MKVSVVIAAYDEKENVKALAARLLPVLDGLEGWTWEMVWVVDGTDGTREVIEELGRRRPEVRLLWSEKPAGLGRAFRRGFAAVGTDADYVVTMDADLNHQPEELPGLLAAAKGRGLDILVGSRFIRGSSVEGTPPWKRVLSGTMNVLMRFLFGLEVRDKTSGYRVYRADVVRSLSFQNDDFAALPEILIRAARDGRAVGEAPIRFVYRVEGVSKMHILTTTRSYLRLLGSRFDTVSLAALGVLLVGAGYRLALTYPVHRYPADADALMSAMRAFLIREGHFPVFYSYVRIGALESYVHAVVFAVVGVSRFATTIAPLSCGLALLLVSWLTMRSLLGRALGVVALLFVAIPSPSFGFWTYMPNGYPETILFSATVILCAVRSGRAGGGLGWAVVLGLAAGLGFWNSVQTLCVTVPVLIWLAIRRAGPFGGRKAFAAFAGMAVLGALPWLAYNVRNPLGSFRNNFAARPAAGLAAVEGNVAYVASYQLPELIATLDPENGVNPPVPVQRRLRGPVLAIHAAALVLAIFALARALRRGATGLLAREHVFLLWGIAFTVILLASVSEAGQTRGLTVRYVLPLYLLVPVALTGLLAFIWKWSRFLAATLGAAVLVFNVAGAFLPWTAPRQRWAAQARADEATVRFLLDNRVDVVLGSYWMAYPFYFLTDARVLGLPCSGAIDHYRFESKLPARPVTWVLLSRTPGEVEAWARAAGLEGVTREPGPGVWVFVPAVNPVPAAEFLPRARAACPEH